MKYILQIFVKEGRGWTLTVASGRGTKKSLKVLCWSPCKMFAYSTIPISWSCYGPSNMRNSLFVVTRFKKIYAVTCFKKIYSRSRTNYFHILQTYVFPYIRPSVSETNCFFSLYKMRDLPYSIFYTNTFIHFSNRRTIKNLIYQDNICIYFYLK